MRLQLRISYIKPRRVRWAGHTARMGEVRNEDEVLVGKSEGKRPLGRLRSRWEDNIVMNFNKVGWEGVESIHLA